MKGHKGRHHKASGGREGLVASGNPDVLKEAKGEMPYAKGDESDGGHHPKKRGGRAKRKDGGKVLGLMTGGGVRPRLDRPGRRMGGRVGSDRSPLSTAHRTAGSNAHPESADSYGGMPKE